jgi:S-formylglutathione hydrolase FrmB
MSARVVAILAVMAAWPAYASPATAAPPPGLQSVRRMDDRLVELQLRTSHVDGPTGVRVLLPRGYATSKRRYPVPYLLHGAIDDDRSWTAKGDAERITAGLPLIVVMPDSGPGGGYTNWYNGGAGGRPAREGYHIAVAPGRTDSGDTHR